jgi:hypothetical protein
MWVKPSNWDRLVWSPGNNYPVLWCEMIGSLCIVRASVMVTMSTTGAHYFSNNIRMHNLYGSEKKKNCGYFFNRLIVISFGYEQKSLTDCEFQVELFLVSSRLLKSPRLLTSLLSFHGYAKQSHALLMNMKALFIRHCDVKFVAKVTEGRSLIVIYFAFNTKDDEIT